MRPHDLRARVRLRGADLPALAFLCSLAQGACTHTEPAPPVLLPEPAATSAQVAPRAALPPTERPGAVVILGPDPSVGRVRPREPPSDEPYYLERGIVSRAGPRWIARATRAPVAANDPAFAQWSRRRQKLEDQRWGGGELGDLGL